jgi:small-conductance mechanosensitive channel
VKRAVGYAAIAVGLLAAVVAVGIDRLDPAALPTSLEPVTVTALAVLAAVLCTYGVYLVVLQAVRRRTQSKRRAHDARNVLRLAFTVLGIVAVLGIVTEQWVGVLFSLGVAGFAITFALQQPLLSLLGWFYITVKQPYSVGDRVAIEDSRGDVIDVDFLVTTLWEINGDLVSTNQPSGRIITVPNSVVLSSQVTNYSWEQFPHVWNELTIQVAYETDLEFAREVMIEEATAVVGEEMRRQIERYRQELDNTPVELELRDQPTVNIVQEQSWLDLRVRYLVHPKRGTRVRNELYERIIARFNAAPDQVKFPVGRNR